MPTDKDLHTMSSEELGQLFPIIIQEPSDKWFNFYEKEKQLIEKALLQSAIERIDHIGSTAIPGLKAKPTIDILLQLSERIDIKNLENVFKSLGYQLTKQPDNPPPHMTFLKGYTRKGFKGQAYHVHIRFKGDWDEIRFRDYLIEHSDVAKEYESLKLELAVRFRNDREAYTDSKTDFIKKIIKRTRTIT